MRSDILFCGFMLCLLSALNACAGGEENDTLNPIASEPTIVVKQPLSNIASNPSPMEPSNSHRPSVTPEIITIETPPGFSDIPVVPDYFNTDNYNNILWNWDPLEQGLPWEPDMPDILGESLSLPDDGLGTPNILEIFGDNLSQIASEARPALVSLYTRESINDVNKVFMGLGVCLHQDGYVITLSYLLTNAPIIEAYFHGSRRSYMGDVVFTSRDSRWRDSLYDEEQITQDNVKVILLKLRDAYNVPYIPTAKLNSVHKGDVVMALGHVSDVYYDFSYDSETLHNKHQLMNVVPMSEGIFTMGTVMVEEMGGYVIRSDTPINIGGLGGPLLNVDGQVVGINYNYLRNFEGGHAGQTTSLSIKFLYEFLACYEMCERDDFLGIKLHEYTHQMVVKTILSSFLGEVSTISTRLQIGDVVVKVDDKWFDTWDDMVNLFHEYFDHEANETKDDISFMVRRTGFNGYLRVFINKAAIDGGVVFAEESLSTPIIIVQDVRRDAPAASSGLLPYDHIESVNGTNVSRVVEFYKQLYPLSSGSRVILGFRRGFRQGATSPFVLGNKLGILTP